MFTSLFSNTYPTNASDVLPMLINADIQNAVPASDVLFTKKVTKFAVNAPKAIPGKTSKPHNKIKAKAKPEHGQTGEAFEYSNATIKLTLATTKYTQATSKFKSILRMRLCGKRVCINGA